MIELKLLPLPPTDNNLRRGSFNNRAGFKSAPYRHFLSEIEIYRLQNRKEILEQMRKLKEHQHYFIECVLYLERHKIFRKDGKPKRKSNDTANFNKALHDAVSSLLGIDDGLFNDQCTRRRVTSKPFEYVDVCLSEMTVLD